MAKFYSFNFIVPVLILLFLSGCLNNIEDISGGEIPDPSEVSFSQDIQQIITTSCGGSGCHIPNTTNGVNLSSYANIMNSVGAQYGENIIVPGNADASPLVDKIQPNPQFGQRMPLTGGFLTADEINKIKAWIEGGAENN